ncbi:MAG: hypothetical protein IKP58_17945 [Victivallales bacterium]|nr:hypothetical protein [Victivallales bacterium]
MSRPPGGWSPCGFHKRDGVGVDGHDGLWADGRLAASINVMVLALMATMASGRMVALRLP